MPAYVPIPYTKKKNPLEAQDINAGNVIIKFVETAGIANLYVVPARNTLYMLNAWLDSDANEAYIEVLQAGYPSPPSDNTTAPLIDKKNAGFSDVSFSVPLPVQSGAVIRVGAISSSYAIGGFTGFLVPN